MKIKEILLDALFTPNGTCPICGRVLFSKDHFLCGSCKEDCPKIVLEPCIHCGRGVAGAKICKDCVKAGAQAPDGGCAWLDYSGTTQKIISGMKFHHRRGLCVYAGKEMAGMIARQPWAREVDVIVPVPVHPARLKERGYNQSLLIARGVSQGLSEKLKMTFPIDEVLCRVIDTPHQVGKGRTDRMSNLKAAFQMKEDAKISNQHILLIDDVLTTGATTRACMEVLRQAGCSKVYLGVCAAVSDFSRG